VNDSLHHLPVHVLIDFEAAGLIDRSLSFHIVESADNLAENGQMAGNVNSRWPQYNSSP